MKYGQKLTYIGLFCIAMSCILLFIVNHTGSEFEGSRTLTDTVFALEFSEMNGEQTHTLTLEKDDELECRFQILEGIADIDITAENGENLYRGNSIDRAEFSVIVPDDGNYTVRVKGERAKGVIDIRRSEET